jgi:hypothetical protein
MESLYVPSLLELGPVQTLVYVVLVIMLLAFLLNRTERNVTATTNVKEKNIPTVVMTMQHSVIHQVSFSCIFDLHIIHFFYYDLSRK